MKRIACIVLLGIYTVFNMGLVVNTHYCSGKVSSVSIFSNGMNACGICGKKQMAKDCCKDTKTQLSMKDDQSNANISIELPDFSSCFALLSVNYPVEAPSYSVLNNHHSKFYVFENGPPKTPIYIQIQSLLI